MKLKKIRFNFPYGEFSKDPNKDLKKRLELGVVNFSYFKLNGELREARGTRNIKGVPGPSRPRGLRTPSPTVITYFDFKKKRWRCFKYNRIFWYDTKIKFL